MRPSLLQVKLGSAEETWGPASSELGTEGCGEGDRGADRQNQGPSQEFRSEQGQRKAGSDLVTRNDSRSKVGAAPCGDSAILGEHTEDKGVTAS